MFIEISKKYPIAVTLEKMGDNFLIGGMVSAGKLEWVSEYGEHDDCAVLRWESYNSYRISEWWITEEWRNLPVDKQFENHFGFLARIVR